MPANVSQAAFQPISPLLNLDQLVEETDNFEYVTRVSLETIEAQGPDALNQLITLHVVLAGRPLVIEGFHKRLPRHLFNHAWLDENVGTRPERSRDLAHQKDLPMTIGNYLRNMSKLTEQWWAHRNAYRNERAQRLYLKDIDCPEAWHQYLTNLIPPTLFYLNDSSGDVGGPASIDEQNGPFGSRGAGKGIAPAGDLMSSLPPDMRAENMMCYIGHEGTYTPAHREMCATLGHNLMVETSESGVDRWGKPERPGSSVWFMTETKDRYMVSEFWLSILGHDIEVESHFAQINAWKMAPFKTYVVEQKVGDFILIPPLAPHQVWNRGTRTMKVAWNRTSVETLEMALREALPRARMVCRDEQYKCKAIIYFTVDRYYTLLRRIDPDFDGGWSAAAMAEIHGSRKVTQLKKDFRRLYNLLTDIMLSEMFSPDLPKEKKVEMLPFDSNVTCAYCRCNIFNRFLTCKRCVILVEGGDDDAYDVCMECYAMGRSCACLSGLHWVEQFSWDDLLEKHEEWRHMVLRIDGGLSDSSPQKLHVASERSGKKMLAHICQEQLRIRAKRDPVHPVGDEDREEEPVDVDDQGRRKKKRRSSAKRKALPSCHICKHVEADFKLAHCTSCERHYCYGTLFRAFDLMPQTIMENPNWECPHCLSICSCGSCRKDPKMTPYEPNGTLVGHDTKLVADPRSVESLVDFSRSNISWIAKNATAEVTDADRPYETARLRKFRDQAERDKARDESLTEDYADLSQPLRADDGMDTTTDDAPHDVDHLAGSFALDAPASAFGSSNHHDPIVRQPPTTHVEYGQPTLPPPAAMLDGAPATARRSGQDSEMSELERNPQAFLASASLADLQDREEAELRSRPSFVTPAAMMIDPRLTQHNDPFGHPASHLRTNDGPAARLGHKRKHQDVNSDDDNELDDANREFRRAQMRKTLEEAKKTDQYFITEGRLKGKQMTVKLSVDRRRLAETQGAGRLDAQSDVRRSQDAFGGDGAHDAHRFEPVIVQSDLPDDTVLPHRHAIPIEKESTMEIDSHSTRRKPSGRPNSGKKSRKHIDLSDTERDGDFKSSVMANIDPQSISHTRRGRLSSGRKPSTKYTELSDSGEDEVLQESTIAEIESPSTSRTRNDRPKTNGRKSTMRHPEPSDSESNDAVPERTSTEVDSPATSRARNGRLSCGPRKSSTRHTDPKEDDEQPVMTDVGPPSTRNGRPSSGAKKSSANHTEPQAHKTRISEINTSPPSRKRNSRPSLGSQTTTKKKPVPPPKPKPVEPSDSDSDEPYYEVDANYNVI